MLQSNNQNSSHQNSSHQNSSFEKLIWILKPALIGLIFLLSINVYAQSAVFQTSLEKISLKAVSKPVERTLSIEKWFINKTGKEKSIKSFHAFLKKEKIYATPPLKTWVENKFFNSNDTSPEVETWALKDGSTFIIRIHSPSVKDNSLEIYNIVSCGEECKKAGYVSQLQYKSTGELVKYDPRLKESLLQFEALLLKKGVILRNFLLHEIKTKFFNYELFNQKFKNDEIVTWTVVTNDKIFLRFAREKTDLNLEAISIPTLPYKEKGIQVFFSFTTAGFQTSNEDTGSILDVGSNLNLKKIFNNGWGVLTASNISAGNARFIENVEVENPNIYYFNNSSIVNQEFLMYYMTFVQNDLYLDTNNGIVFGWRALYGLGYNFLGFENPFKFDPVISAAAGYRAETDEIAISETAFKEVDYKDLIGSYRASIGNINYGSASFYWNLMIEYQHAIVSSNSDSDETTTYDIDERFRVNYKAQFGLPILGGKWKLYLTYLREQISDQLGDVTNNSGMLSIEAKFL